MKPTVKVLLGCFAGIAVAAAQDTRHVTEPVVPPVCETLSAQLAAKGNVLREEDEGKLDTQRIQKAIDHCRSGYAVELKADGEKNAFLSATLEMRSGVTLLLDKGVTLYASRNPRDFDSEPGTCGLMGPSAKPCKPLISVRDAKDVGIMGEGVMDGRGDRKLIGKNFTWWQQSRAAQPKNEKYSAPRLIVASHADGLVLYNVRLHNSPNFHVTVNNTDGFTAWGVHILTPTVRGTDARNTDGIDPGSSENITVTKSWIDNGDDNIAIKTGVHKMSVLDNHFYSGHGMSIGSETYTSDSDIYVDTLTLDHTTSGIRIKSNVQRGGPVRNVVYRHVCMQNVPVPISISPFYTGQTADGVVDNGMKGDRIPDFKGIRLEDVLSLTPGIVQAAGIDADHITEITLDGVEIKGLTAAQTRAQFLQVHVGPKGTNIHFQGNGVTAPSQVSSPKPDVSCAGKFPAYQE